jgi:DNA-binding NarL/FixJ family response regulator
LLPGFYVLGVTLASKSILVADDSETMRTAIRTIVEVMPDITICGEAKGGLDAIEKAKQLKPDLILLDLCMPQLNGVETCAILKTMMPKVPVVLFTMYEDSMDPRLKAAVNVDVIVSKRTGFSQLVECIQKLLGPATIATPMA